MALINLTDLKLGYDRKVVAQGINLVVAEGDYLCVVGENGSGKSTLMKTILGLIPPLGGSVEFGEGLRQNQIGYLPQQTELQRDFPATVWEIVLSGFCGSSGLWPFYSGAQKKTANDNLAKLGIDHLASRCYRELSGGQQQRVLLARALCSAHKVLLLDEPVAGLDPDAAEEMYRTVAQLNREGMAIIMISHDVALAAQHASHVLSMGRGGSMFFGDCAQYREQFLNGSGNLSAGGERA